MLNLASHSIFIALLSATGPRSHNPCAAPVAGRLVPADFVGGRIFARWQLHNTHELRFYLDTGGNVTIFEDATPRLGVKPDSITRGGNTFARVLVSGLLGDSTFPPIAGFHPDPRPTDTVRVMVWPDTPPDFQAGFRVDGILGAYWFADRVWIIDYPHRRLYYNGSAPVGLASAACWVSLGFQVDSASGRRTTQFPRIAARIDNVVIEFLVDIGARTTLTPDALRVIADSEPPQRAASFITRERFEEWRNRHPDWLVIPHAEEGDSAAMIRVPAIQIGDQVIKSVWFTVRPDSSFRHFMSQYMDRPVEGALGGTAWKHVTLILDYPRARAAVGESAP